MDSSNEMYEYVRGKSGKCLTLGSATLFTRNILLDAVIIAIPVP